MNKILSWRDHASLFSGDKFRIIINGEYGEIKGIYRGTFHIWLKPKNKDPYGSVFYCKSELCTLVARPMSDMTEQEKADEGSRNTRHFIGSTPSSFIYLLSIGVLPPQFEHQVDTGDIKLININS